MVVGLKGLHKYYEKKIIDNIKIILLTKLLRGIKLNLFIN